MLWVPLAYANEPISTGNLELERPMVTSLGFRWPFVGDDDGDAVATVRFREQGGSWRDGLRPHRVRPENVVGFEVDPEFAGSIFGLKPDTAYDVEVTVSDPDGGVTVATVSGSTRAVPTDPSSPNAVLAT